MSVYDNRPPRSGASFDEIAAQFSHLKGEAATKSMINRIVVLTDANADLRSKLSRRNALCAKTPWKQVYRALCNQGTNMSKILAEFARRGDKPSSLVEVEKHLGLTGNKRRGTDSRALVSHGLLVRVDEVAGVRRFVFRWHSVIDQADDFVLLDPIMKKPATTLDNYSLVVHTYHKIENLGDLKLKHLLSVLEG